MKLQRVQKRGRLRALKSSTEGVSGTMVSDRQCKPGTHSQSNGSAAGADCGFAPTAGQRRRRAPTAGTGADDGAARVQRRRALRYRGGHVSWYVACSTPPPPPPPPQPPRGVSNRRERTYTRGGNAGGEWGRLFLPPPVFRIEARRRLTAQISPCLEST